MKLLILNASPKKRGGASQFFSGILRLFLPGLVKKTVPLRSRKDFDHALSQLGSADAVCISFPLYVDGLPSHLVEFLSLAEEYCKARSLRFRLYAIANNGFIEGQQNRKEPLHPCAASILPVCSDCRSVYDSILSVLRPVPVRTFKTGRLFS